MACVWHASKFRRDVLVGLPRIGVLRHQQKKTWHSLEANSVMTELVGGSPGPCQHGTNLRPKVKQMVVR